MLTEAPMAIAVCGDRRFETDDGYLALDCAAAAQNILLSATDLGLGTVWIGIYPRAERMTELKKITELPEYIIPINLIAVGFADEKKHPVDRYQSDRVFLNKYENLYNA
jgi:nitroreductase